MKYVFPLLFFLFTYTLFSADINVEIERLSSPLNGIIKFEDKAIAYGDNGIILVSTDNGKNWEQRKIFNDSLDIISLKLYDNKIVGFTNKSYGIESNDAETWNLISLNPISRYFDPVFSPDKILVKETQYINKEKITRFIVMDYDFNNIKNIDINEKYNPHYYTFFNNKLLFSCDSINNDDDIPGVIKVIDINDVNKVDTIDVRHIGKLVKDYKIINDKLYMKIDDQLYTMDSELQDLEYITYNQGLLTHYKNVLYEIKEDFYSGFFGDEVIKFSKIYDSGDKELLNNPYDLNSVGSYNIRDVEFINDEVIIAIGDPKTILRSSNAGKNWDLISNISSFFSQPNKKHFWINDTTGFVYLENLIYKTTNQGTTWKPIMYNQKYMNNFFLDISNHYLNSETGEGIFFSLSYESPMDADKFNLAFTDDYGETIEYHWYEELWHPHMNSSKNLKIHQLDSSYLVIFNWRSEDYLRYLILI